jgi:hypothetical protein
VKHLTLSLLLLTAAAARATTLQERFDKTFDVRPGSVVALGNLNGHITIGSWDQPRVRVQALRKVSSRDNDTARSAMKELRIEISPANGGLHIVTHYPKRDDGFFDWIAGTNVDMSVTYELTVPRQVGLQVENTNGGLDVAGVSGSLKLETTNGRIKLIRCAGDIYADTTNGGISAELLSVSPGRPMHLETTNGSIDVAVPRSVAFAVDAENTNGSIETDLPVSISGAHHKHDLHGTINGGGPELRIRTTNGGISIHSR